MLAMVSLGIIAVALNWFDLATAFPLIGTEFKAGLDSSSAASAGAGCTSRE
jgi:hypothetical protein